MMMMIIIIRNISFSYTFLIFAVSKSNNVTHSKETNIIIKMTCSVMKRKQTHFNFPMDE